MPVSYTHLDVYKRQIKRFNKKAECIMDDMASWNDYIKTIKEELGIELGIRENK